MVKDSGDPDDAGLRHHNWRAIPTDLAETGTDLHTGADYGPQFAWGDSLNLSARGELLDNKTEAWLEQGFQQSFPAENQVG